MASIGRHLPQVASRRRQSPAMNDQIFLNPVSPLGAGSARSVDCGLHFNRSQMLTVIIFKREEMRAKAER